MNSKALVWRGPSGVDLPSNANTANVIVPFARGLTPKQQTQVIIAFEQEAYDMGAEYIWRKAMTKLRNTLSTLGMKFIGEMLGRDDIGEFSGIETVLTDYDTISLSEQIGVINSTGALKLKQALEVISHYFSERAEREKEELTLIDGIQIVTACVKYILGEQDISIAIEFSKFRERLLSERLTTEDIQVQQLLASPMFYIRTVLSILLNAIKTSKGAVLEHAVVNLNLLITNLWLELPEKEKWTIGTAYRDVTSDGNIPAALGLKQALMKVSGFDYVPENLRSTTYKRAAKAIIEAHFNFGNFYTEKPLVNQLRKLGSTIPSPALIDCMQAYLCVYLGNAYGFSFDAAPFAETALKEISIDRWLYYLGKAIQNDEVILAKLMTIDRAVQRFYELLSSLPIASDNLQDLTRPNMKLVESLLARNVRTSKGIAADMFKQIKEGGAIN